MSLTIVIPDEVEQALKLPQKGTTEELKRLLAVKLYEKGILGIGKAREFAELSLLEFYALLKVEGVPLNYDEKDLAEDVRTLEAMGI